MPASFASRDSARMGSFSSQNKVSELFSDIARRKGEGDDNDGDDQKQRTQVANTACQHPPQDHAADLASQYPSPHSNVAPEQCRGKQAQQNQSDHPGP